MLTRFAPSPTGLLHLGHAYSAGRVWALAAAQGGEVRLRIEDIDHTRCRPAFEAALIEDLDWLGLRWHPPARRQSEHTADYQAMLDRLIDMNLVYACTATRKQLLDAALSAPQSPSHAPEPGISRPDRPSPDQTAPRADAGTVAWRLDLDALACALPTPMPRFLEAGRSPEGETGWIEVSIGRIRQRLGPVVLGRKDAATSYHIACVHDDALQQITDIVRGDDLFDSAHLHVALQAVLGLPTPVYHHHGQIRDEAGKRLAKRDGATALQALRAAGATPGDIWARVGLPPPGPNKA